MEPIFLDYGHGTSLNGDKVTVLHGKVESVAHSHILGITSIKLLLQFNQSGLGLLTPPTPFQLYMPWSFLPLLLALHFPSLRILLLFSLSVPIP